MAAQTEKRPDPRCCRTCGDEVEIDPGSMIALCRCGRTVLREQRVRPPAKAAG